MITVEYVQLMARYNQWMNQKLYASASQLSEEQLTADRGAFFKSLHGTLAHIIWADNQWMNRFLATPDPVALDTQEMSFVTLSQHRQALDATIQKWAGSVDESYLSQQLTWFSGLYQRTFTEPMWRAVMHFFNHQTHHRGQATTLLMQFGMDPGPTDLIFMTAMPDSIEKTGL